MSYTEATEPQRKHNLTVLSSGRKNTVNFVYTVNCLYINKQHKNCHQKPFSSIRKSKEFTSRTLLSAGRVIQMQSFTYDRFIQVVYNDLLRVILLCVTVEGIRWPRDSGVQLRSSPLLSSVVTRQRYEKDAGLYLRVLRSLRDYTAVKIKLHTESVKLQ